MEIDLACKISVTNHLVHCVEVTLTFDLDYFFLMLWLVPYSLESLC